MKNSYRVDALDKLCGGLAAGFALNAYNNDLRVAPYLYASSAMLFFSGAAIDRAAMSSPEDKKRCGVFICAAYLAAVGGKAVNLIEAPRQQENGHENPQVQHLEALPEGSLQEIVSPNFYDELFAAR